MENNENIICVCPGYAFVPVQYYDEKNIFSADDALKNASIFPELVLGINEYGSVCKSSGGAEK